MTKELLFHVWVAFDFKKVESIDHVRWNLESLIHQSSRPFQTIALSFSVINHFRKNLEVKRQLESTLDLIDAECRKKGVKFKFVEQRIPCTSILEHYHSLCQQLFWGTLEEQQRSWILFSWGDGLSNPLRSSLYSTLVSQNQTTSCQALGVEHCILRTPARNARSIRIWEDLMEDQEMETETKEGTMDLMALTVVLPCLQRFFSTANPTWLIHPWSDLVLASLICLTPEIGTLRSQNHQHFQLYWNESASPSFEERMKRLPTNGYVVPTVTLLEKEIYRLQEFQNTTKDIAEFRKLLYYMEHLCFRAFAESILPTNPVSTLVENIMKCISVGETPDKDSEGFHASKLLVARYVVAFRCNYAVSWKKE